MLEYWVICNCKPKTVLLLLEYILYSISVYITVYYADIVLFMEKTLYYIRVLRQDGKIDIFDAPCRSLLLVRLYLPTHGAVHC